MKQQPERKIICCSILPCFFSILCLGAAPATADVILDKEGKVRLQSDFRFRFETDWDSRRPDGSLREDRSRIRIRARAGIVFEPSSKLLLGFRLRSGSIDSQQSPHVTIADFDDNPTGDKHALLDRYYARYSQGSFWVWGGRNSFPFWTQNELFWDEDVTPAGGAVGFSLPFRNVSLQLNGGYFALPDGGVRFGGRLEAAQGVFSGKVQHVTITAGSGVFKFEGDARTRHLRDGNGARNYTVWVTNFQVQAAAAGRAVTLGLDVIHNSEDYRADDPDPVTAANHDQNDGWVFMASLGQLRRKGDWSAAYYYARIETLAVNASFAQDDWVRWGSANQTDSSNFEGHELRFACALAGNANLMARLYLVEAIKSVQDGKRFRVDLNFKW